MPNRPFTCMTFHRLRFPAAISANSRVLEGPASALHWVCGPDGAIGKNGLMSRASDVWGGAAFYPDLGAAKAVMDDPAAGLPFLSEAVEAWHALICPISHWGKVNWFGPFEAASQFVPAPHDPGGPVAVMTSAGFDPLPPDELDADMPRRLDFVRQFCRVRDWFGTLPGNAARAIFLNNRAEVDGMTFTLWESDAALAEAAYHPGIHRTQLDRYKAEQTADRTSFTRGRVLRASGTWDGAALV